jgi:DNA-binding MarR family transcriptional regulator
MSRQVDRAALAVSQWEQERPGDDYLPMEILGRISELGLRNVRDFIEPLIAAHGLQRGDLDALLTLRRSGLPYRLTPTQLFESMMMSSGGMTSLIDRLERADWVERSPNPEDRRGTLVTLTAKGREVTEAILPDMIAGQVQMVDALDAGERADLARLLAKMLAGLAGRP